HTRVSSGLRGRAPARQRPRPSGVSRPGPGPSAPYRGWGRRPGSLRSRTGPFRFRCLSVHFLSSPAHGRVTPRSPRTGDGGRRLRRRPGAANRGTSGCGTPPVRGRNGRIRASAPCRAREAERRFPGTQRIRGDALEGCGGVAAVKRIALLGAVFTAVLVLVLPFVGG